MLLAELEVFHSRPIAPTRRVALGVAVLPTTPAPGFGGLLLAGIASTFLTDTDPEHLNDLLRLTHQVEAGQRISQPRLRHRFQDDRVGLAKVRHRLIGTGEGLRFEIDDAGAAEPNVLAAVYAAGRLGTDVRTVVMDAIRRGLRWQGELGASFAEYIADDHDTVGWATLGGADPVLWALDVLGLAPTDDDRFEVQARFRSLLREAHPDHGGATADAAQRIRDLTEARRILLAR